MDRFQALDDIQLAVLLSLVAKKHCLITSDEQHLDALQRQLEKIGTAGFGLTTAVISCTPETTLDEFILSSLVQDESKAIRPPNSPVMSFDSRESFYTRRHRRQLSSGTGIGVEDQWRGRRIADLVIARNLDIAPSQIQIQALELIRNKRLTRKEVYTAPERFLFIALVAKTQSNPTLNPHLCDQLFISHYHDPSDLAEDDITDQDSATSVIIRKPDSNLFNSVPQNLLFSSQELDTLTNLAETAHLSTEIKRYIMDIIVFLRMHRGVAGGISAKATKDFEHLVKCLCPLNGLQFATPSLVALAVYKIYGHRIVVADKETDRSVMWGSKKDAVDKYLAQVDADMIIDNVLEEVRAPL
ncbi:hypothetical protein DFH27DRAFT_531396 [Peziza echinospora]|nr:hypothetical protein DFH27DRAFT_531396 [Peziza echinospora]